MLRGPLSETGYKPQFSGHETFSLRYGWLKKVYDRVVEIENANGKKDDCWDEDAIARFGVGKNMVASMRHWTKVANIITESSADNSVRPTKLGHMLFGKKSGLDQYMEHPATLWLLHWQLAARPGKTTWYWAFNHYPDITFDRENLAQTLSHLAQERGWPRSAKATIKKDVSCFVQTYVTKQSFGEAIGDDNVFESPLTELNIIKSIDKRGGLRFVRGAKPTLGDGVFTYALIDFWRQHSPNAATLAFEAIAHAPGSPGRVFAYDENSIADRLEVLGDITDGKFQWSETAGLKQVVRTMVLDDYDEFAWLEHDYH